MIRAIVIAVSIFTAGLANADTLTVIPDKTTIGTPFILRLSIDLQPGEMPLLPKEIPLPEGAELLAVKQVPSEGMLAIVEYEIESYKVGVHEIPQLEYELKGFTTTLTQRAVGPVSFEIVSVRTDPESADKLKEIKPPIDIPIKLQKFLPIVLLLLAVAIAAILLWRWFAKKRKMKPTPHKPPPLAHEIAYEQLDKLKSENPFGHGREQEHFFRVSEIVRGYMEQRFGMLALERTTCELKEELINCRRASTDNDLLFDLLEECDIVKFAKRKASQKNADDSIANAKEYINRTRQRPAPPEGEQ